MIFRVGFHFLKIYIQIRPSERKRLFSEKEIIHSLTRTDPELTLLGIFCAKEAIKKVLLNYLSIDFIEIEILHSKDGKPYASIDKFNLNNQLEISISHSLDYAMSACILK